MVNTIEEARRILAEEMAEVGRRRRLPSPAELRAKREEANLSQAAMARAIGVARSSLTRWETGGRKPLGRTLQLYLAVLDAVDELVDERDRE